MSNTNLVALKTSMENIHREIDQLTKVMEAIQEEKRTLFRDRVQEMSLANKIYEAQRFLHIAEYTNK